MKDYSDYILSLILLLLSGLMVWGVCMTHKEKLDTQMESAEHQWETAVERRKEKQREWCVNYVSAWSSNLGTEYDPEVVMGVYKKCVK